MYKHFGFVQNVDKNILLHKRSGCSPIVLLFILVIGLSKSCPFMWYSNLGWAKGILIKMATMANALLHRLSLFCDIFFMSVISIWSVCVLLRSKALSISLMIT